MSTEILRMLYDNEARLRQTETKEVPLSGAGTAFPASPPTGMRFWRTDLGFLCYYDGTRWLTAHEYYTNIVYNGTSAVLAGLGEVQMRTDYAPYITHIEITTIVATTNNGTNYWTVAYRGLDTARGSASTIHSFNTSADTVATYTTRDTGTMSTTALPTNRNTIQILVSIGAGAPGAITVVAAAMNYRLVIT